MRDGFFRDDEFSAALGLLQLRHIDEALAKRQAIDARYRQRLAGVPGVRFVTPAVDQGAPRTRNFAYFPILVGPGYPLSRDALYQRLRDRGILARRYFYPLISSFPMYRGLPSAAPGNLPVATAAAAQVLCLPIYPGLLMQDQDRVVDAITSAII